MLVARLSMNGKTCVFKSPMWALDDVEDFLDCAGPGDDCTIVIAEMSKEEFESLPEFEGW